MTLTLVAMLVAFVFTLLSGIGYINFLNKKLYHQQILEEAPENHKKKAGTPTTGGVFFVGSAIFAATITLFMEQATTERAFVALITFFFFMLAGFLDDFQKINKKQNKGVSPRTKLGLQIAISFLPVLYMILNGISSVNVFGFNLELGLFYPLFVLFVIVGVSNAVNLTDGLDGLAASNCVVAFLACALICLFTKNVDLAIISSSIAGACFGFLYFNKFPAKVFMGDTGSLALGGILATIAVMGKFEFYLILIGVIFLMETLSVMIQVTSFKLTGKRVFKMSPIHHHFELCGWSETKIVNVFVLVTLIASVVAVKLFMVS